MVPWLVNGPQMSSFLVVARGCLFATALASGCIVGAAAEPTQPRSTQGQVFMFSGLMGEALSPGFESFADRIRSRGIPVMLASHSTVGARSDEAIAAYRAGNHGAIVLIGHSFGAGAAVEMARTLRDKNIPVRLIVTIGPTSDLDVPGNVAAIVNYYQPSGMSKGKATGGSGFRGSLRNVNMDGSSSTNHFNMVKDARVQNDTIGRVTALVSARRPTQESASRSAPGGPETPGQHGVN